MQQLQAGGEVKPGNGRSDGFPTAIAQMATRKTSWEACSQGESHASTELCVRDQHQLAQVMGGFSFTSL